MTLLGFQFDTENMTVIIPKEKLRDMLTVVEEWSRKTRAVIHDLRGLLGNLFHVV